MNQGYGITVFSPAKVNLFLAITGPRDDGFHNLVSVVTPLRFGDQLWIFPLTPGEGNDMLEVVPADTGIPTDERNLILRAVRRMREVCPHLLGPVRIRLRKRIPAEAGLGGGSSNASVTLRALWQWLGRPFTWERLIEMAAELGSDCPVFLNPGPSVMRGRGEFLQPVVPGQRQALSGQRILLFKPAFGVETGWAYREMRQRGTDYITEVEAEAHLGRWQRGEINHKTLVMNNMERVVDQKFLALPSLRKALKVETGSHLCMSGSGSASFVLLDERSDIVKIRKIIKEALGTETFIIETSLL